MNFFEKVLRRLFPTLYKQQQETAAALRELKRQNSELRGAVDRLSRSLRVSESALRRQIARADMPGAALAPREIDILGAMPDAEDQVFWGDLHFALALKKEFERRGWRANVRPVEQWYAPSSAKYTLVLRGLTPYYPPHTAPGKRYLMWNISHPAAVAREEYDLYDHVFFASERLCRKLRGYLAAPSSVLLQCTDPEVMCAGDGNEAAYELLFVGSSRSVYRRILRDLLPTDHRLTVFGRGWDKYPVAPYVEAPYLDNAKVAQAYHDAAILLNDHWDDMREAGILSNRLFDALAAGAFVISDDLPEIGEVFGGAIETYRTPEELREKIDHYLAHPEERRALAQRGREIVLAGHTFRDRVDAIEQVLETLR